jgi:hypothetical protein
MRTCVFLNTSSNNHCTHLNYDKTLTVATAVTTMTLCYMVHDVALLRRALEDLEHLRSMLREQLLQLGLLFMESGTLVRLYYCQGCNSRHIVVVR